MYESVPSELKIQIVLILISILIGASFILFISVLLLKASKANQSRRNKTFQNQAEDLLNELFATYDELNKLQKAGIISQMRKLGNRTWKKRSLTDLLVHYKNNLSGGVEEFVFKVYYELGLQKLNLEELRNGNITQKVRAMRCLSEMRYQPAWIEIIRYINDEISLLRVESSLSLLFLTKKPLFFLDNLLKPMTGWQKINVYKGLKELPPEKIPKFSRWFNSPNKSVLLFALEMAGRFNQVESKNDVAKLLTVDDEEIQGQTIDTLIALEAFEYADIFIRLLKVTHSDNLKIKLIKAVGNVSMETEHLQVLSSFLTHPKHELRFQASKAILKIEDGDRLLKQYVKKHPDHLQVIARHLSNPILN